MDPIRLKLYIAGDSPRSLQALANLERRGRERLAGRFHLEVVDVVRDPEAAETDRILTTPTLVREAPLPSRRVTGDLSDGDKVLVGLALFPYLADDPEEPLP